MAVKPGALMKALAKLVDHENRDEFALDFLKAYGIPKATLTQIRKGTGRNETDEPGAVALKNKIYIKPVANDEDVYEHAAQMAESGLVRRHKIRFVLATNFTDVAGHDVWLDERMECDFAELPRHYSFFLPLAGYERIRHGDEAEADVRAADRMGRLCDQLREVNPQDNDDDRHRLNVFLTRVLFCLYAEDTGIFKSNGFTNAFNANTAGDGTDAAGFLRQVFKVLNTPHDNRDDVPAHLSGFPYVNGGLFEADLAVPEISPRARRTLIDAGTLDWKSTNPDIFGSMFQAVIDPEQRGTLGQHYTSVSNILKVIRPLFLDDLETELDKAHKSPTKLRRLLERLHSIRVFDPACGCGNFLIIAYKELRRLEIRVFRALDRATGAEEWLPDSQSSMFPDAKRQPRLTMARQREIYMSGIHLDQFYGIELEDFAHEVARLALWIAEHQMQQEFKAALGDAEPTLPLRSGGNIVCDNSLRLDWKVFCDPDEAEVFVCGNPPYLGWRNREAAQNADMQEVFEGFRVWKKLDFVATWVWKAAQYVQNSTATCGFVTTNSICQGEQVHTLWPHVHEMGVELSYAFQSFAWKNAARYSAGVHVIVIGLRAIASRGRSARKTLYERVDGRWHGRAVVNISPYLIEGPVTSVESIPKPLCNVPAMEFGNMPNDGGNLILDDDERDEICRNHPEVHRYVRELMGSEEFFSGKRRWCLWLLGADPETLLMIPAIRERIERVRAQREDSTRPATRDKQSRTPHLFGEIRYESGPYLLVPAFSSENRDYLGIGFFNEDIIPNNKVYIVPNAGLVEFALISSTLHLDWMRLVGGRMKSDYSYSAGLVYNTFPWPTVSNEQRDQLESLAQTILDTREGYFHLSMGELYHPKSMPADLLAAHQTLDQAVERLYRVAPFADTAERQAFLLERYAEMTTTE